MKDRKVVILMATYNGEAYLREQLDSLLNQTYKNLEIVIRDDGSKDKTKDIIKEYADRFHNIEMLCNNQTNLGAMGNFFELIKKAPESDYYALCDQDDVWDKDKISIAVNKLEEIDKGGYNSDIPYVYCGAKNITDSELNVEYVSSFSNPRPSWNNALVENICTGCTCVINKKVADMINEYTPVNSVMHDWWIYLIGTAFGKVVYDTVPHIYYRQHGSNEYGDVNSFRKLLKYRVGQLFAKRGAVYLQIDEFLKVYGSKLDIGKRNLAREVVESQHSLKLRRHLIRNKRIYRQQDKDNKVLRFLVLTGKL